ncbi:MAG: EcsC family protein [Paracoccaceae bacterium]
MDTALATKMPLDAAARAEIAALAARQAKAAGLLMKAVGYAGNAIEDRLKYLPEGARGQIEAAATAALRRAYDLAESSRSLPGPHSSRANKVFATMSGALGGAGGLPTALAEVPVATALIFRAVQDVAARNGEDPKSPETRAECLRVFGTGSDGGFDTSFMGARMALSGHAVARILRSVAPKFAAVLGNKIAAQAVPILGAVTGAGINYAFVDHYVETAEVHFALRRLSRLHPETEVEEAFQTELARWEGTMVPATAD